VTTDDIMNALAEPFEISEVKWKPAVISGNRAMAIGFVDARVIQDRLDDVLGVAGWQDEYEILADASVMCRLRVKFGDEWITKVDVGGPSEQPDGGDRMKAAFSDALKRAAVKFGLGRYLYRLPAQWVDYDPQKRQFARTPTLPDFAKPKGGKPAPGEVAAPADKPAKAPKEEAPAKAANGKAPAPVKTADGTVIKSGADLKAYVIAREEALVTDGFCEPGGLYDLVAARGEQNKFHMDMTQWDPKCFKGVLQYVAEAEAGLRVRPTAPA
jgi:hypothetical protein